MGQLSETQLRRLEEHRYSCASTSLMDPLMQKWWCWLVEQCPLTLAPNLITITGLIINIITSLVLCYYSPDAKQEIIICSFQKINMNEEGSSRGRQRQSQIETK
ncbi:Choline/ethanolaminephosphotransferase 1 [Portunus trituberculatus]|uniref:Choline/ethanolaminephosphotransferase 1 n=1 Tax=Portunus trituberculatus TaxID=210409 RepID=A0A5B7D5Z3_PORTR|nr:Choline/ethanolaminephosphotransferase 1 [Portunus trituberculatus]